DECRPLAQVAPIGRQLLPVRVRPATAPTPTEEGGHRGDRQHGEADRGGGERAVTHRSYIPFRRRISAVSFGTMVNRSPTTKRSANSPIGASGSLLIASTFSAVCIPTRCWIAPLMPQPTYNAGFTTLPVWPI